MADSRICCVDGCDKPVTARGWCNAHYRRWLRRGAPDAGRTPPGDPLKWIANNASYNGDECISWPFASGKNGYGNVAVEGVTRVASRVMCCLVHGEPAYPDLQAAHSCGNGALGCMNPKHLRWATGSENNLDKEAHGTINRGKRNGSAKISAEEAKHIISMKGAAGQKEIAEQFGISFQQVSAIQRGLSWGWVAAESC